MITIDFSARNKMGLCEFLIHSIKQQILDGTLKPDEKLPSKRNLSEHLGISVITVQNAYGQLISEGYIYSLEKKGFYVTDIKIGLSSGENQFKNPVKEENDKFLEENDKSGSEEKIIADFTSNSTSAQKFPFSLWAKTMRQVLNRQDQRLLERVDTMGVLQLRKAIGSYLRDFRNMDVSSEQIVIGAGTEYLFTLLVQILGRDKNYAVENPGYKKIASIIRMNGSNCVPVSIDDQGIDPKELVRQNAQVVHVSPAHHFPTGIVMPIRRRRELLEWVSQEDERYIIEDDYDSEFRFNGKPLQTLQSTDAESSAKVIFINTFSKTISPSFRISYMVLPRKLVSVFREKAGFYSCPVSAFEQWTLAEFISNGSYEKHINRMKNFYRSLRNDLINALHKSSVSRLIKIHEQEAGLHFLLTVKSELSGKDLKKRFLQNGIKLNLLSEYYYQREEDLKTFIVNYSGIRKEKIGEIIEGMEKVLKG